MKSFMSLQPAQYDAVIVGGVRLASVLIAAVSMDKVGRKILLYVSGAGSYPSASWYLFVMDHLESTFKPA